MAPGKIEKIESFKIWFLVLGFLSVKIAYCMSYLIIILQFFFLSLHLAEFFVHTIFSYTLFGVRIVVSLRANRHPLTKKPLTDSSVARKLLEEFLESPIATVCRSIIDKLPGVKCPTRYLRTRSLYNMILSHC